MTNEQSRKFTFAQADLSDIQRKVRNLLRRSYCLKNKNIVIATPTYQEGAENPYTTIYEVDKFRFLTNLRDALYLRDYLSHMTTAKTVEVIELEEDVHIVREKLEQIDCLILSHSFTELDKNALLSELEEYFDCENIKIIQLR